MKDSIEEVIEAIISLRKQYYIICQISANEEVLKDPSLNLSLLEMEERLIEAGIISIYDVENPERIKDLNN